MTILQCRTKLLTKVHILFCIKLAKQYRTETDRTDQMKRGVRTVGEVRMECRCNYNMVSNNRSCRTKTPFWTNLRFLHMRFVSAFSAS